ncbi:MAG: ATP-binding cassette domain-containing protein [Bacteroidales bacterium]|nr:ATP-binding cassette domain-containing protein [Bacteroidales bacterium]MCF8406207.1 ATP-binding cassette domain-containing protein [Bacteroidales bacterium]
MNNTVVFKTKNLCKAYGSTIAIKDVSLRVEMGQIFGILGPNGSGKTTTLSIATGIIDADNGDFQWFDSFPDHNSRKKIGSLIEIPNFYPYLNLVQNLNLISKIKDLGTDDTSRVLKLVKLYDRRYSKFKTLSLGMKQRLGIAAAMLGDPEVMVLDEPTNGLDPEGIVEVRDLIISEAKRGKTILMASHILSEVEKVCSHVAILKNGKLLEQGSVSSIIKGKVSLEISADDINALYEALKACELVDSIKHEVDGFLIELNDDSSATELNAYLFSKSIILSKIIHHKKSLESQFLKLVKDNQT